MLLDSSFQSIKVNNIVEYLFQWVNRKDHLDNLTRNFKKIFAMCAINTEMYLENTQINQID